MAMTTTVYGPHGPEYRRDYKPVLAKWCLTSAQMDVLRRGAAKWNYDKTALHDGRVNTYGVRADTMTALREGGFVGMEYDLTEEQRHTLREEACALIREAFALADGDPFDYVCGVLRYVVVRGRLLEAEANHEAIDVRVERITAKGREAAAEWKQIIGAVEE